MKKNKNPFEYEGSNNLSEDEILEFYIEDYNYSRFIQSTRNIFLIGERGTGKTMALLYNSFKIQYKLAKKQNTPVPYDKIGIHIPCNTPLFHKKEHLLIDNILRASIVSEHFLVLSLISHITLTLTEVEEIEDAFKPFNKELKEEFEYVLGLELHKQSSFLSSIYKFVRKEIIEAQRIINSPNSNSFYENAFSFSSLALPFINSIKRVPILKDSHFMLMIDDAHDLNKLQIQTLNSWIAYRDHSDFSFKVATTKSNHSYVTSNGGSILEGHDFTSIEMGKLLFNKDSDFAKMAKKIIQKRLNTLGNDLKVDDFFPINPSFEDDLEECKQKIEIEAKEKFKDGTKKQIADHIYKYARAEYFRSRSSKANRPPYSGFDTIVDISTGVVRNLLDPCFWMYDSVLSISNNEKIKQIPPTIQSSIIISRSEAKWDVLQNLHKVVDGCSEEDGQKVFRLFDNLMVLFRERLLKHKSEPRAIMFSISQKREDLMERLQPLLEIAMKSQLLYTRLGNSKDDGKQEIYYVPNRILIPARGLDPHGQHARVYLKASDILAAAENNKPFPFADSENKDMKLVQKSLFDE
ncbi:ORC-CDC6 family AAA ATPase [Rufibacter immobilis]|uniref:ORC-CDC6 family AAA ATPase n=1 Tax=Rufibacter immobilis TaxID=1348778 RepID=UPI0035EA437E